MNLEHFWGRDTFCRAFLPESRWSSFGGLHALDLHAQVRAFVHALL